MSITTSSISISLVERITRFIIKKEIHVVGGSPFILYREKTLIFGRAGPSDRILLEIASEKEANCC